ncbi:MAG: ABC transporter permease [Phycisphaerales bacterium JB039]
MARVAELRELTRVRVLGMVREPEAIFWVFIFPLVLAAVLGFAFRSGKVEASRIGVIAGPGAEALVAQLEEAPDLEVESFDQLEAALVKLRKSAIDGVIEPAESPAPPQLRFDPSRPEGEMAKLRTLRVLEHAPAEDDAPVELAPVTEKGSRYVDFLFPGLIGMNLMGTGMWGIGFAIADVRRRKFLKRLMVTPMRRSSFLASFVLSRLIFLVAELVVLVAFGAWILGVPMRGDAASLLLISLLGAMLFAGMGILVVSRVRTIEGASGLMNFVMLPMWLLSGVFFSYERFPEFTHEFLRLLPLTALNDALRAVMLDGQSLLTLGPEMAVMAIWAILSFAAALKIFRWE